MTTTRIRTAVLFGGSGFVGYHLSQHLLAQGARVVILDISPPRATPTGVQFEHVDVRQPITFEPNDVDLVVNLAAVHRTPGHDEHEYYETNVRGALNVTRWCAEHSLSRLIFTSSISVYGPMEDVRTEEDAPAPTTSYGRSKLIAEEIHREWARQHPDARLLIIRPAVIFGQYEGGNFTRLAGALQRGRFVYPGRTDTVKACGYVKDLVAAMFFMLDRDPRGTSLFNFAYPHPYTLEEICETFAEVAGYGLPHRIPRPLMEGLISVLPSGEWARSRPFHAERIQKLLTSTNIQPKALMNANFIWPTDLRSALTDWRRADEFLRSFE